MIEVAVTTSNEKRETSHSAQYAETAYDASLCRYGVPMRVLNQPVKRKRDRFPRDFVFQLTAREHEGLRTQFVISSDQHGGRRHPPECLYRTRRNHAEFRASRRDEHVCWSAPSFGYARCWPRIAPCPGKWTSWKIGSARTTPPSRIWWKRSGS